jgi:dienelactone hydrolase
LRSFYEKWRGEIATLARFIGVLLSTALCASICDSIVLAGTTSSVALLSLGSDATIPATLIVPDGAGPFPAVVIVHDCSGLGPSSSGAPGRWADELVPQGYAALIPDSFTPRDLPNGVCYLPADQSNKASGAVRAADAYGGLAFLRTLPYIDGKHVGIIGGSHGGWTALSAMSQPVDPGNPLLLAKRNGFAAAIALYPSCGARFGNWAPQHRNGRNGPVVGYSGTYRPIAPVLILIGEKDDWTPAEPCRALVEASQAAGYPIAIKIYPGAYHSFDSSRPVRYDPKRTNNSSPYGKGATTGGNPEAWADARLRVREFFARYLKEVP